MANPTGKSYVGRFGVHLAVLQAVGDHVDLGARRDLAPLHRHRVGKHLQAVLVRLVRQRLGRSASRAA